MPADPNSSQNLNISGSQLSNVQIGGIAGGNININQSQQTTNSNPDSATTDSEPDSKPPQKTILFLAANPRDTSQLRLEEEAQEIQIGLERSRQREQYQFEQRWAVTPKEIRRALLNCKPQIVHFSGHGKGQPSDQPTPSESRKLNAAQSKTHHPEGLVLEGPQGESQLVPGDALASLFEIFAEHVECVVLNACYSETQANAIAQHIPYVIGMDREIGDRAAIEFSVGFYDGLLAGKSIETSYRLGCSAIQMAGIPEHLTPVLQRRDR